MKFVANIVIRPVGEIISGDSRKNRAHVVQFFTYFLDFANGTDTVAAIVHILAREQIQRMKNSFPTIHHFFFFYKGFLMMFYNTSEKKNTDVC